MGFPFKLKEGWEEIPAEMAEVLGRDQEFWYAAGRGDVEAATPTLWRAGVVDAEDPAEEKEPEIEDIFAMEIPDEMLGARFRVWIKPKKKVTILEPEEE
jgi:hypothetical protein